MAAKEKTEMRFLAGKTIIIAALAASMTLAAADALAQPLRRDLASYFILAQRKASLKNFKLDTPCNIGVNCGGFPNSTSCGTISLADITFALGSQTVANSCFFRKPGGRIGQLFCNAPGPLDNVEILQPPVQGFAPPIIPNTCDACTPNIPAIQAVCDFPAPFPACNPAKSVKVSPGGECAGDTAPGNGVCDLPPGVYGTINILNGAAINFSPGDYVVCDFKAGRSVKVQATATRMLVDGGSFKANNNTDLAEDCGDLEVKVRGPGQVSFGRNALIAAKICAPESTIKLGHNNLLIGQFVGDIVNSDLNNRGVCCAGRCVCYDVLSPTAAKAGDTVTATGQCDMSAVSEVRVCGVVAAITSKSPLEVKFTVPVVPGPLPKQCKVEFLSPAGTYEGFSPLTVNP